MNRYKKTFKYSLLLIITLVNFYAISEVPASNAKYYKDNSNNSVVSLETFKYNYRHDLTYKTENTNIIYYPNNIITYEFNIDRNTAIYSGYDEDKYTFSVDNNNCSIVNNNGMINNEIKYTDNNSATMKVLVSCNVSNITSENEKFKLDVKEETTNSGIINFLSSENILIDISNFKEERLRTLTKATEIMSKKFPYINNVNFSDTEITAIQNYLRDCLYENNNMPGITYSVDENGNYNFNFDDNFVGYALTYNSSVNKSDDIESYELLFSTTNNTLKILETYLKYFNYSNNQITAIINSIEKMNDNGLDEILSTATTNSTVYDSDITIVVYKINDNIINIDIDRPDEININANSRARRSISKNVEINNYTIDNDTNVDSELSDKVITDENVQDLIKNGNENKLPDFIDYTTIVDDKKIVLVIVYNATTDDEVSTFVKIIDFDSIEDSDILYLPINPTNNEFENLLKITNEDGSSVTYELLPAIDGDTEEYIYEENDNNIKCYKYSINKISE